MNSPSKRVLIDTSQWTEESRRLLAYLHPGEFYKDTPFLCWKCGRRSVFTAQQKKYTYEVKKAHTSQQHVLCRPCFQVRLELSEEAAAFQSKWELKKCEMRSDLPALRRYKEILELLPYYRVAKDEARINMLAKLLGDSA